MAVLRYAAGKKHGERYDSRSEQCHENEVRTRLRNDSYHGCKKDHEHRVVADPVLDVNILEGNAEHQQDAECPCKYSRQMLLYDMIPKVSFNKMIRAEYEHEKNYHAQRGKQDIHPVLA